MILPIIRTQYENHVGCGWPLIKFPSSLGVDMFGNPLPVSTGQNDVKPELAPNGAVLPRETVERGKSKVPQSRPGPWER